MLFGGYFGSIKIGDGMRGTWTNADIIRCQDKDGSIQNIRTRNYGNHGKVIWEYKRTKNNRILEWFRFGAFSREYNISGEVRLIFHPDSLQTLHGTCLRTDQTLFGAKGRCRTKYSHGRFIWQEFRYKNHKIAFSFHHTDKKVTLKRPNGSIAAVIECLVKGFSTRGGDPDHAMSNDNTATCHKGVVYFHVEGKDFFNYSKDGNCKFTIYDRQQKIKHKGEYRNRQQVGEWILSHKHLYYINGVPVSKKLWETPPEKVSIKAVMNIKNAQMRAALMARIPPERFAKEAKYKVIHKTKDMVLMEFPVRVDDGNGGIDSKLRILQVTCPSTKSKYFLNVPDFVWDGGKRTKLNLCEQARQWTFGVDNPRKKIKFAVET
ncbi:MAG: hypothetical protein NTY47_00805 [Candidatus Omnitrophica bacterium]|nr:hypothetical protein [Candidatus Omnitrophota bacterium]